MMRSLTRAGRRLLSRSCPVPERRPLHCTRCLWKWEAPGEVTEQSVEKAYSAPQTDAILEMLNTASERQLRRVEVLQGGKSARIVQYREDHGPFLDLDSLGGVLDVGHIKQLCDSVLSCAAGNTKKDARRGQSARFIKPDISIDRLQAAESVVSIVFGLRKLAWAHVDRTMTVRDWQLHEWSRFIKGKQQPEVYLEDVSQVVSHLPAADLYILEKPALSLQSTSLFPVMLHLHTVEAMLYALLNPGLVAGQDHRVFSMARNTVGKHFEIMVGESKTSGVDLVQRLVNEAAVLEQPRLRFSPSLILQYKQKFQARGQNRNEEMCDALLQALALYELAMQRVSPPAP